MADLPFSSGTTGQGKGVEVSHRNITAVSLQLQNVGIFQKDIVMGVLPLYRESSICVQDHQGEIDTLLTRFDPGDRHLRAYCTPAPDAIQQRNCNTLAQV